MSLELVKPREPSTFDAGEISPELAESGILYYVRPADEAHVFQFSVELEGEEVAEALALDAAVTLQHEDVAMSAFRRLRAIKGGLRTLTYPNSRIMRNARHVDREARNSLICARADISGLIATIDHPEHHRMVPAKLNLYSDLMADFSVDKDLHELKPAELKQLCDKYGVSLDELALQRLKGRRRDTYVDAAEFVDDPEALKARVRLEKFKRAIILPEEDESVLTDAEDWPKEGWAEKADAIQLLRMLPEAQAESLGARWQVLIRDDSSARHVVRPRLIVKSETEERTEVVAQNPKAAHAWTRPANYLLFDSEPPTYDRSSHTVVHSSAVLGAVMLMKSVESALLGSTLQAAIFGKGYRPRHKTQMPDKALGLSPLVAQSTAVQRQMLASPAFKRLVYHVDAQL